MHVRRGDIAVLHSILAPTTVGNSESVQATGLQIRLNFLDALNSCLQDAPARARFTATVSTGVPVILSRFEPLSNFRLLPLLAFLVPETSVGYQDYIFPRGDEARWGEIRSRYGRSPFNRPRGILRVRGYKGTYRIFAENVSRLLLQVSAILFSDASQPVAVCAGR